MEDRPCPSKSSFVKSKMLRYKLTSFREHILILMNWLNALILSFCCCRGLWVIDPLSPWFLCLLISNVPLEYWSISFVGLLNSWKRWAPIHLSTWLGSLNSYCASRSMYLYLATCMTYLPSFCIFFLFFIQITMMLAPTIMTTSNSRITTTVIPIIIIYRCNFS